MSVTSWWQRVVDDLHAAEAANAAKAAAKKAPKAAPKPAPAPAPKPTPVLSPASSTGAAAGTTTAVATGAAMPFYEYPSQLATAEQAPSQTGVPLPTTTTVSSSAGVAAGTSSASAVGGANGVIVGVYGALDATGWSTVPVQGSTFFVANAGSDSNNGLSSSTPIKTVAHLLTLLTPGASEAALFNCGDTWTNDVFGALLNGASSTNPRLLSYYGNTTLGRPIFAYNSAHGPAIIGYGGGGGQKYCDNVAVIGLDFYKYDQDPANGGFDPTYPGGPNYALEVLGAPNNWLLIEDCKFRFAGLNLSAIATCIRRRNIIVDAYNATGIGSTIGHISGIFEDTITTPVLEENLIDANGYNATLSAFQTATLSIGSPCVLTLPAGLVTSPITNGSQLVFGTTGALPTDSSTGQPLVAAWNVLPGTIYYAKNVSAPSGGHVTMNFSDTQGGAAVNTTGTQSGTQSVACIDAGSTIFNHNIYLAGTSDPGTQTTGQGPAQLWGNIITNDPMGSQGRSGLLAKDNLFAYNGYNINFGCPTASQANYITHNVVLESTYYGLGFVSMQNTYDGDLYYLGSWTISDNIVASVGAGTYGGAGLGNDTLFSNVDYTNNVIYKWGAGIADGSGVNPQTGNAIDLSGTNSGQPGEPFPNPTVTMETYDTSIGGPGTMADFITQCRNRALHTWPYNLSAQAVVAYVNTAF